MIGKARFGLELAIETVAVDPFTLALSIDHLTLLGPENTPVVAIDRIDARLQPVASVLAAGWVLQDPVLGDIRLVLDGGQVAKSAGAVSMGVLRIGGDDVRFDGDLVATAVAIGGAEDDATFIDVEMLSADGAVIDASPSFSADLVRVERPVLRVSRDAAGLRLLPPAPDRLLLGPAPGGTAIARVEIASGTSSFRDDAVDPPVAFRIREIEGAITRQPAGADRSIEVMLRGRRAGGGSGEFRAEWLPGSAAGTLRADLSLRNVGLSMLSPYIAPVLGRELDAGSLDLDVDVDGESLLVSSRLVVHRPEFGDPIPGTDAPPVELAVALLGDAAGNVSATIVVGDDRVVAAPARVLSVGFVDYVERLAAAPFDYVAEFAGEPDLALDVLAFLPGSAEFGADTRRRISALGRVMQKRPALGLAIHGGYGAADRAALAREQIRLHVTLASSARPPGAGAEGPIEFDDPTVRGVIEEFAAERLPAALRADIRSRFETAGNRYHRALFDALADNEPVTRQALQRLARYRARTAADALEAAGIDPARLTVARDVVDSGETGGGVVRLTLQPAPPGAS